MKRAQTPAFPLSNKGRLPERALQTLSDEVAALTGRHLVLWGARWLRLSDRWKMEMAPIEAGGGLAYYLKERDFLVVGPVSRRHMFWFLQGLRFEATSGFTSLWVEGSDEA